MKTAINKWLTSLLRHHSVHSWSWRKWMLVSTSRVSRTVRVCRVTVLSSTGNDMEASGVMSFECSRDLSATQRWCSFWTLKNHMHKIYDNFTFKKIKETWILTQIFLIFKETYQLEIGWHWPLQLKTLSRWHGNWACIINKDIKLNSSLRLQLFLHPCKRPYYVLWKSGLVTELLWKWQKENFQWCYWQWNLGSGVNSLSLYWLAYGFRNSTYTTNL